MAIDFPLFDNDHVLGDCAMHPIAPRLTRQAALLRLVGISLLRCPPCRARLSRSLSRALQGRQRCGFLPNKAEQRGQRAVARLNRVRSALTQEVRVVMGTNLSAMRCSQWKKAVHCRF